MESIELKGAVASCWYKVGPTMFEALKLLKRFKFTAISRFSGRGIPDVGERREGSCL